MAADDRPPMVIAAPLLVERLALRGAQSPVTRTGMGPDRSVRSRARLGDAAVLVAGVAGGLVPAVRVGHLVVASEVRSPGGESVPCWWPSPLVDALRGRGLVVHYGPVVSSRGIVGPVGRARLAATGAFAVDMESWWLAPRAGTPFAVVRAISDGVDQPLLSPALVSRGLAALRGLRRAVPVLDAWGAAVAG